MRFCEGPITVLLSSDFLKPVDDNQDEKFFDAQTTFSNPKLFKTLFSEQEESSTTKPEREKIKKKSDSFTTIKAAFNHEIRAFFIVCTFN